MEKTKNEKILSLLIIPFFALYFIILAAERVQSLVRSFADKSYSPFSDTFGTYIYMLAIASLVASFAILLFAGLYVLTSKKTYSRTFVTFLITVASGVILLSGMVHTEYTVAPVQFISYGALIVAMILKTVLWQKENIIASLRWLTLSYIVAFSMAIPVCYRATSIEHMSLFYIAECATSFLLVGGFTYLLYLVMTDAPTEKMLNPIIPAVSLVGNTLAIALWWREKINAFVLIFLVISTILWLVTAVISAKRKKS